MEKENSRLSLFKKHAKKYALRAGGVAAGIAISLSAGEADRPKSANTPDTDTNIEMLGNLQQTLIQGAAAVVSREAKHVIIGAYEPNILTPAEIKEKYELLPTQVPIEMLEPTLIFQEAPDRQNCEEMRGTSYRSGEEKDFFRENCILEPNTEAAVIPNQVATNEALSTPTQTPNKIPQQAPSRPSSGEGVPAGNFSISKYYCQKIVGYPGWDNGGFCTEGASGLGTISGQTAACGPSWPFGTVFEIPGYGQVVCTDRGGAVHDGHLDIYFDTDQQAWNTPIPSSAPIRVLK